MKKCKFVGISNVISEIIFGKTGTRFWSPARAFSNLFAFLVDIPNCLWLFFRSSFNEFLSEGRFKIPSRAADYGWKFTRIFFISGSVRYRSWFSSKCVTMFRPESCFLSFPEFSPKLFLYIFFNAPLGMLNKLFAWFFQKVSLRSLSFLTLPFQNPTV